MTRARFEELVAEAVATIPRRFRERMQNLTIVVEDEPSDELLDEMDIPEDETLFGLYQGTPLTERDWTYGNALPDRITLFQWPIEDSADDDADVVVAIGETLIHEVGHYFGLSEDEIEAIEAKYLARRGGGRVKARKRFGQHFLQAAWAAKIADAMALAPTQAVIEVGPGQGVLTRALLERHPALTAIEIDRDLIAELRTALPAAVNLVEGDVLRQSWPVLCDAARAWHQVRTGEPPATVRVVGNLPYNIASPLLIDLLHAARDATGMLDAVVMVQREVAERIVAVPDTADYGPLAVVMQTWADATRVMDVPPGAFRPVPKVWSTVIRLRWREADITVSDIPTFDQVTRRIFQQRRKQLTNTLLSLAHERGGNAATWLADAGLDGTRRPGTLTRPELARLAAVVGVAPARGVV